MKRRSFIFWTGATLLTAVTSPSIALASEKIVKIGDRVLLNLTTKIISVTEGPPIPVHEVYSEFKQAWCNDPILTPYPFPLMAVTKQMFYTEHGYIFDDSSFTQMYGATIHNGDMVWQAVCVIGSGAQNPYNVYSSDTSRGISSGHARIVEDAPNASYFNIKLVKGLNGITIRSTETYYDESKSTTELPFNSLLYMPLGQGTNFR